MDFDSYVILKYRYYNRQFSLDGTRRSCLVAYWFQIVNCMTAGWKRLRDRMDYRQRSDQNAKLLNALGQKDVIESTLVDVFTAIIAESCEQLGELLRKEVGPIRPGYDVSL